MSESGAALHDYRVSRTAGLSGCGAGEQGETCHEDT
jgi:hypothetical protein